jgi:hypothetical protein
LGGGFGRPSFCPAGVACHLNLNAYRKGWLSSRLAV